MAKEEAGASFSSSAAAEGTTDDDDVEMLIHGSESGWVEARTSCDHLNSLSSDLTHIPIPNNNTPCTSCLNPTENWLCLCCKDVFCSRFVNKHMLHHFHTTTHGIALSFSDLSVWCFQCDSYLDAQLIPQLRPVYETAYILKFGVAPPFRNMPFLTSIQEEDNSP
ncbi:histone deacetylase 6 [Impatiens glandulifera]|uniref:histone deacetylase 6 n=1 Tax=Impatiens glandulifera TaxID=253017 RepID=UPI001FB150AE|nr:histone deacetylase 6 [Impatiens glandulifera]